MIMTDFPARIVVHDRRGYGLIKPSGEVVVEPWFSFLGDFHEGLACFKEKGNFGFIDLECAVVIPAEFECDRVDGPRFSSGVSSIARSGRVGYIDHTGKFTIAPSFQLGWDFVGDYAFVDTDAPAPYQIINKSGDIITSLDVHEVPYFPEWPKNWNAFGCLVFNQGEFLASVFNIEGRCIFPPRYPFLTDFCDGVAGFCEFEDNYLNPYGLVDLETRIIKQPQYYSLGNFEGGVARAGFKPGQFGYINTQGKWVIEPRYRSACSFSEGLACVALKKGKKGFVNLLGEMVIEPRFDRDACFHNGLAEVEYEGKRALINKTGKIIWETEIEDF